MKGGKAKSAHFSDMMPDGHEKKAMAFDKDAEQSERLEEIFTKLGNKQRAKMHGKRADAFRRAAVHHRLAARNKAGKVAQKDEKIRNIESQLTAAEQALKETRQKELELTEKISKEETLRTSNEKKIEEQRKEFDQIKEQLKVDFENLANSILEEKSQKFTQQNKQNLDTLLMPLSEKIKEFKDKVEKTYEIDLRDRAQLQEQIKNLTELNVRMSDEANKLTTALKGQSKTIGNWGELVLETLLEHSGLNKGEEYLIQESFKKDDGNRSQPDVIINLPEKKHLVIDSKASLVAYERYCSSSENDEDRKKFLNEHITSIKNHISLLTQKNYQDLYQISTPDFIFMFVPLDSALILALQNAPNLLIDAFNKGIFLVSPSTLLFALLLD